jgi:putative hemolysin
MQGITNDTIASCLKQPLFIPESMKAFRVIEQFKKTRTEFAIIVDEYGVITGLVTSSDVLRSIAGEIPEGEAISEPPIIRREDGSYLVDAMIPIQELNSSLKPPMDEEEELSHFDTLAGWVLARMGKIPLSGDFFESGGLRFEIVDMDGNRIDKVLITRQRKPGPVKNSN